MVQKGNSIIRRPTFRAFALLLAALALAPLNGCGLFSGSHLGPAAARNAKKQLGAPYLLGGTNPRQGFDCSGLTYYVYRRLGLELPRSSSRQAEFGRRVKISQLRPGDLVFFSLVPGRGVSHVGLYLGGGKFIHAPGTGKKVTISELASNYYGPRFHSARRVS